MTWAERHTPEAWAYICATCSTSDQREIAAACLRSLFTWTVEQESADGHWFLWADAVHQGALQDFYHAGVPLSTMAEEHLQLYMGARWAARYGYALTARGWYGRDNIRCPWVEGELPIGAVVAVPAPGAPASSTIAIVRSHAHGRIIYETDGGLYRAGTLAAGIWPV